MDAQGNRLGNADLGNLAVHPWWRLQGLDGVLKVATSADGVTFVERGSLPASFPLDQLSMAVGAGAWMPLTNPGRVRLDCFNVPPPCP
jgi:hypothetical protein